MLFSEKLKQAMQDLHLNQIQVVGLTGKSKGSISQYISGKQVPSEATQRDIAISLGLEENYFSKKGEDVVVFPKKEVRNGIIQKLEVTEAAKILGMTHTTVRKGLQQGVFPWGYAIHTSENTLQEQMEKLLHTSNLFYNVPAIEAAKLFNQASGME